MSRPLRSSPSRRAEHERPTFSVIIPVHNRPKLAFEAIDSVLRQSHSPSEVIVVDDASCPPLLLEDPQRENKSIRLVRVEVNVGAAAARNLGALHATGTHLAFLDSDDLWCASHLSSIERVIREYPSAVAIYSLCRGRLLWPLGAMRPRRLHTRRIAWPSPVWKTPGTVVQRATFAMLSGFEESLQSREDTDLFIRLREAGRIASTGRITVVCRKQSAGLSRQGDRDLNRQQGDYLQVLKRQINRGRSSGAITEDDERRFLREFHRYWAVRWFAARDVRRAVRELSLCFEQETERT